MKKTGDVLLAEADASFGGKGERNLWGKASPLYDSSKNVIGAVEAMQLGKAVREDLDRIY